MCLEQVHSHGVAYEQAIIGMAYVSEKGDFLHANHSLCSMLGYKIDELRRLTAQEITYLDDRDEVRMLIQAMMDQSFEKKELPTRLFHRKGHILYLLMHVTRIREEHGEIPTFLIQFQIRTEEQMLSQRMNDNEEALEQLLEDLPLAVLITRGGSVQYANPAGIRLIGASHLGEVLGLSTTQLVDASYHRELEARRQRYRNYQHIGATRYRIHCLTGELKDVEGVSVSFQYRGSRAVLGIYADITERKREEEYLAQSEKLAVVGQLAAGIAHEIRNPLTSINGFMKLFQTGRTTEMRYFQIMESELKRIESIINELLILARPHQAHLHHLNIVAILDHVMSLMNGQAIMKNVEIQGHFDQKPIWVSGDSNQLKQVLINLVKNAINAMQVGGNVYVSTVVYGQEVHIIIRDEGCGMTAEQLEQIGQPFYSTKETGTGLGLMISYNIIGNHGGSITASSELNQGTSFEIVLPLMMED